MQPRRNVISITGAAENNLKNINLEIPRDELVVFTGLSGSGKSSLAFDTIYAEGQRRYMESLSSYARQFLGQMEKPDVERIEGLSPAISIDQKSTNKNPRSTVGTVTEIYDYFRLLYARIGIPHCPNCGREIKRQTVDQMVDQVMALPGGSKIQLLAPVVQGKKGEHAKVFERAKKAGYVRVIVDGNAYELSEEIKLDKNIKHSISIIVDRLVVKPGIEKRMTDSIETILSIAEGLLDVEVIGGETLRFSESFACPDCGISISEIEPRSFSFNNPFGACPVCAGLGYKMEFDPELMVPDDSLSISKGAIQVMGWQSSYQKGSFSNALLVALAKEFDFSLDTPFKDLPEKVKHVIFYGTNKEVDVYYEGQRGKGVYPIAFEGLVKNTERRYRETGSEATKAEYEEFMRITPCTECQGMRLKKESLAVTVNKKNIYEVTSMSIEKLSTFLENMKLTKMQEAIGHLLLKEIRARVGFLKNVGLDYLTLARSTGSLSGGEAQRIRLATQIGSGLVGVCYILDEPSIGLHQRDNGKLLQALKNLRDLGNTLIVVEHDEETMREADCIVDIGPGAGSEGGEVVAIGTAEDIMNTPESVTGQYLSGKLSIPIPKVRRVPTGYIKILGAAENNLKDIDVDIPLGVLT
ncbi:MAG: excinuclease ABC subunit UvrA, partial [Lachnospiraceae bacterium]|nr:excinuclease ABC subunit UvrA [Lachnospiraceae bacterium]